MSSLLLINCRSVAGMGIPNLRKILRSFQRQAGCDWRLFNPVNDVKHYGIGVRNSLYIRWLWKLLRRVASVERPASEGRPYECGQSMYHADIPVRRRGGGCH